MNYGLAPRPPLAQEEVDALLIAVQELLVARAPNAIDGPPIWRFSGRWFNAGRYALRRPHHLN